MKKILLSLAMLLTGVGAWAQETLPTPAVRISGIDGTAYPYEVPATETTTISQMNNMTIMVTIKTTSLSGRKLLVCGCDPTEAARTEATKDNSPYFGFGFNGSNPAYIASSRSADRYSAGNINSDDLHTVTYVVNADEGWTTVYVDGQIVTGNSNYKLFTSGTTDDSYKLQTFKKLFENEEYSADAKIFIGGGKVATGNYETFNGKIYSVDFYNSVLSADDILNISEKILPKQSKFYRVKSNYTTPSYLVSGTSGAANLVQDAGESANSIFLHTGGKLLSYSNGLYLTNNGNNLHYTNTVGSSTNISFKRIGDTSTCHMLFNNGGRYFHSQENGSTSAGTINATTSDVTLTGGWTFTLEEVTTLPVTIGETGYASFYAPVAVTLPESGDLKAYYVSTADETKATMVEVEDGVIPANTGVILQGTPATYNLNISEANTVNAIDNNKLLGTAEARYVAPEDGQTCYVLAKPENASDAGFYMAALNKNESGASATTHFLNNGFKAYLSVATDNASGARLLFDFGTETGIDCIESVEATKDAVVYDLAGRRVQGAQKGLYIVNGKVVVK